MATSDYIVQPPLIPSTVGLRKIIRNDFGFTAVLSPIGDWKNISGKKLALYRVVVLLSLAEGRYPQDPELGVKLPRYIFQTLNSQNVEEIRREIKYKIERYEKDFVVENVTSIASSDLKTVVITVDLFYLPTNETESLDLSYISEMEALAVLQPT